jgi:hypothetical protein
MKLHIDEKKWTAVVLIMIFIASFTRPAAVFADDGAPTEPAPQVEQTQEPLDDDPSPITLPEETQPLPDVLESLPAETGIIVIGDDGHVEPLATHSAADAILQNDPMWCPAGALDGSACYNALTVSGLFSGMPPQSGAGTLYFMSTYNGDDLLFDHGNPLLANLTDMTIQGGWDGVTTGTPTFSGLTTFIHQLKFWIWTGNLTINNIDVQTGDSVENAIVVGNHTGNVTINHSSASDSATGLLLSDVTGDVNIRNSEFSDNSNTGFGAINVNGSISITNSSVDGNDAQGVFLRNVGDVNITSSTFSGNSWEGLGIHTGGDIILNNVHANGNNINGGWSNLFRDVSSVHISKSQFNENLVQGLELVNVSGDIAIENSQFDNNHYWGLVLNGNDGVTTITCSSFNNNGEGEINDIVDDENNHKFAIPNGDGGFNIKGVGPGGSYTLIGCKKTSKEPGQADGLIVPVIGGENIPLDCGYAWTMLELPNGDRAKFADFCGGDSQLIPLQQNGLPGVLPEGLNFSSTFTANSLHNGAIQQILPEGGLVNLSFHIPPELEGKELVILFWDAGAGKWVEIPLTGDEDSFSASNAGMQILNGLRISAGGYASASVNFSGTFVLAAR